MSQSSKIKVIVFMIIFILICGIGTYFAIKFVNDKNEEIDTIVETLPIDKINTELPDNSYLGITLGDKYFENNLTVNKNENNDIVISGLKNKEIEEKINSEIKKVVNEKFTDILNDTLRDYTIYANYSNVLSIGVHGYDISEYINFDLTTGNILKLTDLFINNCDDVILKSIKENAKRFWIKMQYYSTANYDKDTQIVTFDQSGLEKYLLEITNEYNNNKDNFKFYFTTGVILVCINDDYVTLNMKDNYECVSIYKKYVTQESIFENGNPEKDYYCLINNYYHDVDYTTCFEEYNDNLFLHVEYYTYDKDSMVRNNYEEYIKNKVELLKQNSDEQPNTAKYLYMYMSTYAVNKYADKYTDLTKVDWNEFEYTMPKEEYVKNFRKIIFETSMREYNPVIKEYNKDKVSCNTIEKNMYVYVDDTSGEILELSLKDIFVEDYDYISVFKEKIKNNINEMSNRQYEKQYLEENYGTDIFEKMLSDAENLQNVDFMSNLGDFELQYNLEYNELRGVAGEYNTLIYIDDVFDMNQLK